MMNDNPYSYIRDASLEFFGINFSYNDKPSTQLCEVNGVKMLLLYISIYLYTQSSK